MICSEGAVSTRVWRLLLHLPVNGSLERSLRLLSSLDEGEGTPTSEGWLTLLPLGASYTLAYRLEVLRLISCSKVGVQWTQRFVRLRGFQHLVRVLLSFDAERLCYGAKRVQLLVRLIHNRMRCVRALLPQMSLSLATVHVRV